MDIPNTLHDGDLFALGNGRFAEFIDTDGRKAFRVTDALGHGVLLESTEMIQLARLIDRASIGRPTA